MLQLKFHVKRFYEWDSTQVVNSLMKESKYLHGYLPTLTQCGLCYGPVCRLIGVALVT